MRILKIIPRRYYWSSFSVFVLGLIAGVTAASLFPDLVIENLEQLKEKFEPVIGLPNRSLVVYIFLNNTLIDLIAIFGFFLFGLAPLFILLSNGFIIGMVIYYFSIQKGLLPIFVGLAPHGIFEIPAFIIACSFGFWLAIQFIQKITANRPFKSALIQCLKLLVYVIIPLNLIAAIVEVYISALLFQ